MLDRAPAATRTPHARVTTGGGTTVCDRCEVADTFLRRLRGLLGRDALGDGEGMFIRPAGSIHAWFMRFPIDVVFLDRQLRVVRIAESLRPWRLAAARRARSVLELPAGAARRRGVAVGDLLLFADGGHDG